MSFSYSIGVEVLISFRRRILDTPQKSCGPLINTSTHTKISSYISQTGFGKPHTDFGALLSMHAWVITVSTWGLQLLFL